MIFGMFIGTTVARAARTAAQVAHLQTRVVKAQHEAREVVTHAMADRSAAIAELKKDMDALGAILSRV